MVGSDGQRFAKGGFGLGKPAELHQRVGQVLVQGNVGGRNAQRLAQCGHRSSAGIMSVLVDRSEGNIPLGYALPGGLQSSSPGSPGERRAPIWRRLVGRQAS